MLDNHRAYYLQQMGIDVWVPRQLSVAESKIKLMVIGDVSELAGKNFLIKKARDLLHEMLLSVGLKDDAIYFVEDTLQGKEVLMQKIEADNPQLIFSLGRVSAAALLQRELTLEQMRNKVHDFHNIPLVATYHPIHLFRCPIDKKKAYQDLLTVQALLMKKNG